MKKKLIISIMIITFVLTGCSTPQSGNTYITPQQINEPTIAEITPVFEIQIERVNNCDGTNPTYNVSYKTIEAQKASFEVSVGAGGLVTGTPIPPVLEVQLEAKITAALAKDYGLTTEKNHDLTLTNNQGTFLEHTIIWKVTRVKGLIEVVYGDGIAQVGFEKIANVELYDRTSKSLGCDDQSANVPPTTIVASKVPSETQQTEPTPTQPSSNSLVGNSRADTLIKYDEIYQQGGWCVLWDALVTDNLVVGTCPESITQMPKANDISGNPIYAAQMRITSDLKINYPACATFSKAAATAEDGKIISWINDDYIGTNTTMKANSFFTLYFRCEETIAP